MIHLKAGEVLFNGKKVPVAQLSGMNLGDDEGTFPFAMRSGRMLVSSALDTSKRDSSLPKQHVNGSHRRKG